MLTKALMVQRDIYKENKVVYFAIRMHILCYIKQLLQEKKEILHTAKVYPKKKKKKPEAMNIL